MKNNLLFYNNPGHAAQITILYMVQLTILQNCSTILNNNNHSNLPSSASSIGAALVVAKMRENKLRWFRHVIRKEETKAVRGSMKMNVEGKQGRKRPKKSWLDAIENMRTVGICVGNVED